MSTKKLWYNDTMKRECPNCATTCHAGAETCHVCGHAFTRSTPVTTWTTVFVADSPWQANLVASYLEANGVPSRVPDQHLVGLNLAALQPRGGVEVQIPEQARSEAVDMLRNSPCGGRLGGGMHPEHRELQQALLHASRDRHPGRWLLAGLIAGVIAMLCAAAAWVLTVGPGNAREFEEQLRRGGAPAGTPGN